ncbi:MAG: hypothetical protein IPO77_06270 [Acidobacteria bacterium]|nr:hypothetical protein [Acidobacteriota bacterium]
MISNCENEKYAQTDKGQQQLAQIVKMLRFEHVIHRLASRKNDADRNDKGDGRNSLPDDEQHAEDCRKPLGIERHDPVDGGEGAGNGIKKKTGAAPVLRALDQSRIARLIELVRTLAKHKHQQYPDGKINRSPDDEELRIEPQALMVEHRAEPLIGDRFPVHPFVDIAETDGNRDKKYRHQNQCVRTRFQGTPDDEPPGRAAEVLNHEHSQTSQRNSGPENKGHEIRMEENLSGIAR